MGFDDGYKSHTYFGSCSPSTSPSRMISSAPSSASSSPSGVLSSAPSSATTSPTDAPTGAPTTTPPTDAPTTTAPTDATLSSVRISNFEVKYTIRHRRGQSFWIPILEFQVKDSDDTIVNVVNITIEYQ